MNYYKHEEIAILKARSSGTNIFLKWNWMNDTVPLFVKKTVIFYMKEGESKVIMLQRFENSSKTEYTMRDVPIDTNYNICIRTIMTTKWPGIRDPQICTVVTNSKWEMSAFIGSTAGALLALILIILLVLMSKRVKKRQKDIKGNMNQNTQRQRYDSAFESQFDSVAFREDTSFYDDLVTSEVSYVDNTYRSSSSDNPVTTVNAPSVMNLIDNPCNKAIKKRASLIEEESCGSQSCDGWTYTVTTKYNDDTYHNVKDDSKKTDDRGHILETCIDELDASRGANRAVICTQDQSSQVGNDVSPSKIVPNAPELITECLKTI